MKRSFLRHAAIYGLGTLLIHAGGLVLLPIYLRCLSPAEYGVLELVNRLAETVGTCLLFGGLKQALFTFYQQASNDIDRRRVVTATFALVLAAGVVGFVGLVLFGRQLESVLVAGTDSVENPRLLMTLAVLSILIEPFSLMPLALLQARVESTLYAVVVVCQFLFRIGLCILLVRVLHWGAFGALLATTLTGVLFGLSLTLREFAGGFAWPGRKQLPEMLNFALPLLPGGLCFLVLHNGDRFFLSYYGSLDAVGTYSLGYKLAMTVRIFSLTPLYMVWSSQMYAVAKQPDAAFVFGQMTTRILSVVLFASLGMALFAPEVIGLLGGSNYAAAVDIVAPILVVCFLQCAVMMMDAGFYLRHQTGLKLGVTAAATLVILLLYAWLIPPLGALGAVLATIGGFGFLFVATLSTTQKLFPVQYEWGRLGLLLGLAVLVWGLGRGLPAFGWGFPAKAALLVGAPAAAWLTGLVRDTEKRQVYELVGRWAATIRRPPPSGEAAEQARVGEAPVEEPLTVSYVRPL